MKLHASGEDYLEAILVLHKKMGMVRSVDVARHMEVTKPSVCHAVNTLKDGGFLTMDEDHFLYLTDIGREVAEKIYERHCFFRDGSSPQALTQRRRKLMPAGWNTTSVWNPLKNFGITIPLKRENSWPVQQRTKQCGRVIHPTALFVSVIFFGIQHFINQGKQQLLIPLAALWNQPSDPVNNFAVCVRLRRKDFIKRSANGIDKANQNIQARLTPAAFYGR